MTQPVLVGYVRRSHGIQGAVVVRPLTDDPDGRWVVGAELTSDAQPPVSYTVTEVGSHKEGLLVRFAGVDDRATADTLRGTSFTIEPGDRRRLEDGEFWPDDLVGCRVVDRAGNPIGEVEAVEFGTGQDRLAIATDHGTVEIPFVDPLVPVVDVDRGVIVIDPPDGLFASA